MEHTIQSLIPGDVEGIREDDVTTLRPFSLYNSTTGRHRPLYTIVAAAADGAIGRGGDMIWHMREDLRHFKHLTMGHPVIMGRRTFESLPKGALPGRRNIVITRNPQFSAPDVETVATPEEAIALCDSSEIPFVIGGEQVYRLFMPYISRLYLTSVEAVCPEADAFFPEINEAEWILSEESDVHETPEGIRFRFLTLDRIKNWG